MSQYYCHTCVCILQNYTINLTLIKDENFKPVTTIKLDLKQGDQRPGIDDLNTIISKARHTFDEKSGKNFRYIY